MSEYVFNQASNDGVNGGEQKAVDLVRNFIEVLADLDSRLPGPNRPLKLPANPWDLVVSLDKSGQPISLGELANNFHSSGDTRELATFFEALQMYAPAAEQLDESTIEAILRLEITGPVEGHEPIFEAIKDVGTEAMQCAVTESTLVSFSYKLWDFDQAVVACGDKKIVFDHASLVTHVDAIMERYLHLVRGEVSVKNFEATRERAFPSLLWGQDVAGQLRRFPPEYLSLLFKRLAALDDIALRWKSSEDDTPDCGSLELKDESDLTMQNYADERKFRSSTGTMKTFETHVWIDSGNRIHLSLDKKQRTIEIGYVGPHLRTWKF